MSDQIIQRDGSVFLFKPGQNGSTTELRKRPQKTMDLSYRKVAKVVPILKSMRKRADADTGSSRG